MTYISSSIRQQVIDRAESRCEYCLYPDSYGMMPHEIDHIYAEKHGGTSELDNLCWSCWICNRHKGTDIASLDPLTGDLTPLFHPRNDQWTEHFELQNATIIPLSAVGRVTIRILKLNRIDRIEERKILTDLGFYGGKA